MAKSKFKIKGEVYAHLNGVQVAHIKNLVVNGGLNQALHCLFGNQLAITHIGVGTNATAPEPTQTALLGPLSPRRAFDTVPNIVANSCTVVSTFQPGEATGIINEAGLFSALTAGTMFSRVLFGTPIPKGAGDELRVTWVITTASA